jgi:hypothetical protein
MKKDMLDNGRGDVCCPCKHCKNEKIYHTDDMLRLHLIKNGFMEDYRWWNKQREEGLNEAEMRDSYMQRDVPTGVEEDHDDVNEANILGFTDDDIEFQVHNIEKMLHNVDRHGDDDQYSKGELAKYKKMIEYSKKPFYHVVQLSTRDWLWWWNFSSWRWAMDGEIVVSRTCWCFLRTCYLKAM